MNLSVHEHNPYKLNPKKMIGRSREMTEMGQQPVEFFEINAGGQDEGETESELSRQKGWY